MGDYNDIYSDTLTEIFWDVNDDDVILIKSDTIGKYYAKEQHVVSCYKNNK